MTKISHDELRQAGKILGLTDEQIDETLKQAPDEAIDAVADQIGLSPRDIQLLQKLVKIGGGFDPDGRTPWQTMGFETEAGGVSYLNFVKVMIELNRWGTKRMFDEGVVGPEETFAMGVMLGTAIGLKVE